MKDINTKVIKNNVRLILKTAERDYFNLKSISHKMDNMKGTPCSSFSESLGIWWYSQTATLDNFWG
jgi:hypothetical protein